MKIPRPPLFFLPLFLACGLAKCADTPLNPHYRALNIWYPSPLAAYRTFAITEQLRLGLNGSAAELTGSMAVSGTFTVAGALGAGSARAPRAILDITSDSDGLLPPRLAEKQKNAIRNPPAGTLLFDTTLSRPSFYNGKKWVQNPSGGKTVMSLFGQIDFRLTNTENATPQAYIKKAAAATEQMTAVLACPRGWTRADFGINAYEIENDEPHSARHWLQYQAVCETDGSYLVIYLHKKTACPDGWARAASGETGFQIARVATASGVTYYDTFYNEITTCFR